MLLSLIFAILGWFDAQHNKNKASDFCAFYSPKGHSHKDEDYEYFLETLEKFSANNTEIPFSELLPAKDEKDFGFSCLYDYEMSAETAFVSSDIDNKLILSTNIPIRIGPQKKFVSEQSDIRYRQMVYLATKICSKGKYRALNDEKICFEASIEQLNEAIQQRTTVRLSKVGYFDGLITNEAFRSQIREKIKNAADLHSKLYVNLTTEFPAFLNRQEKNNYYLKPLPVSKISHHIGISTIAITSDKQIIYFTQKMNNMIGAVRDYWLLVARVLPILQILTNARIQKI